MIALEIPQLVERCRAGDAQAVEAFVAEHQARVYRLALSILDDPADAEEAAQDALLAALRSLGSFRGDAALTTWLHTITLNVCRARLRRRRAGERLQTALRSLWPFAEATQASLEAHAARRAAGQQVRRAVDELDEKHRLPLILRYYHELPVSEIALILNVPEGTVHSRLNTARARLRARLGPEAGQDV